MDEMNKPLDKNYRCVSNPLVGPPLCGVSFIGIWFPTNENACIIRRKADTVGKKK